METDALISNGFAFSDAIFINAYVKATMIHFLRHLLLLALAFKGIIIIFYEIYKVVIGIELSPLDFVSSPPNVTTLNWSHAPLDLVFKLNLSKM